MTETPEPSQPDFGAFPPPPDIPGADSLQETPPPPEEYEPIPADHEPGSLSVGDGTP